MASIDGSSHGFDLLRRQALQRRLLFVLQGRPFNRNRFPPRPVLLHPAFKPVIQFQHTLLDSLEQLGLGLFNFPLLGFQFLGALGAFTAILIHAPPILE